MATQSPEERALLGRIAAASRWSKNDPDTAAQIDADRAELATVQIERYVRDKIAAAPPLSDEQRDRLRTLLSPERPEQ